MPHGIHSKEQNNSIFKVRRLGLHDFERKRHCSIPKRRQLSTRLSVIQDFRPLSLPLCKLQISCGNETENFIRQKTLCSVAVVYCADRAEKHVKVLFVVHDRSF